MNEIRLFLAYSFSILMIPFGVFGVFHSSFFQFENDVLSVYVKLSSIFIIVISIFLSWYYSNIFIRKKALSKMESFGLDIIHADFGKISEKEIPEIAKEEVAKLRDYEDYKFELFGFSIPFFVAFLTTTVLSICVNPGSILPYIIGCFILTIIIKFANMMVLICDISLNKNHFIATIKNLAFAAKGIQYHNSFNFIKSKMKKTELATLQKTERGISKVIWKSFCYTAMLFVFILILYVIKKEYVCANVSNIEDVEYIYIASMLIYVMFLISFFRYLKINKISFPDISKYQLDEEDPLCDKKIDENNLFIAMHGVYFQDPTKLSEAPLLKNVSFSILPGEFIAISGQNRQELEYLFDILLKYQKVQSGKIYVAGTKSDKISKQKIRSLIGLFDENFGLIQGTIYDNLEMITNTTKKILAISEKSGIIDDLQENVFDENGNLILSQESLLRLQIARIAIEKPKILLIKTPKAFESEICEKLFYDFVEFSSKRKTILIITNNPKIIVYSDKILYIKDGEPLFGTHAELSKNQNYQRFIKNL